MRNLLRFLSVLALLILAACHMPIGSQDIIHTAVAQTLTALAPVKNTSTPHWIITPTPQAISTSPASASPLPTSTAITDPTATATATDSPTPTITLTPTPDLRVIVGEPKDYLLTPEDLPEEAAYTLSGTEWTGSQDNSQILESWGEAQGRDYINKTGRIGGWWVYYFRGSENVSAPETIYNSVVTFKTANGAQKALLNYNYISAPDLSNSEWHYIEDISLADLGDISLAMVTRETQPNGKILVRYEIEFTYKNVFVAVKGIGWEEDVTHELLENAARAVLEKLVQAPLSEAE